MRSFPAVEKRETAASGSESVTFTPGTAWPDKHPGAQFLMILIGARHYNEAHGQLATTTSAHYGPTETGDLAGSLQLQSQVFT